MKRIAFLLVSLFVVMFCIRHCSNDQEIDKSVIFVTPIVKVLDNPQEYTDKVIAIKGRVSCSNGLFNHSIYTLSDETGSIAVMSGKAAPEDGQTVRVEGRVVQVFRFGDILACYFKVNN